MLRNGSGDSSGRESDWSSLSLSSWKGGIQAEGQGGGRGCQVLLLTKLPFLSIISCRLVLLGLREQTELGRGSVFLTVASLAQAKLDLTLRTTCCHRQLVVLAEWYFHVTRMEKTEAQRGLVSCPGPSGRTNRSRAQVHLAIKSHVTNDKGDSLAE
jgi:hypothetical protein